MQIQTATINDVPEILELQHKAFLPVGEVLNWLDAPNITETIETALEEFPNFTVLKMDKILEKFAQHFRDIYGSKDLTFKEEEGRRFFMLYIRPIINGTGNYYIEAQTRDRSRTDMIIDYLGTQYIIEMKIWRGESYNERGENQLFDYLDFYHADKGYLLSFCFNKNSKPEARTIAQDGREIVEVVV